MTRNNSATRVIALVELAKDRPHSHPVSMVWASVLGLDEHSAADDPHEVTARLHQVRKEVELLATAMQGSNFSPELYVPYLENVRKMVSVNNMSAGWSNYVHLANAETLLALRYCAEIVESEDVMLHEHMQALLDEVRRFRNEVIERNIPAAAKEFLLQQLAIMEDGIHAYPIHGSRAIKEAFKRGAGEAVTVEDNIVAEAGSEQISRLDRLWKALHVGAKGVAGLEKLASSIAGLLEKASMISDKVAPLLSNSA